MRILYLNPTGELGGAERVLLDLLSTLRLDHSNWRFRLITGSPGPLLGKAQEMGILAENVPFPPALARLGDSGVRRCSSLLSLLGKLFMGSLFLPGYLRQLRRSITDFSPDLIHTNGFKMHLLGLWARPGAVPTVWHIHDYICTRPMMVFGMRRHASRCAVAVTYSLSVARDVEALGCRNLPVHCVLNGIDLQHFCPAGPQLDLDALSSLSPAAPGTIRVGLLATMAIWKGHGVFLQALSQLPPSLPVRGYLIGGPLYQTDGSQLKLADLRAQATRLGLADKVGLTGFIEDPAAAIRALDIVVHASTRPEPFGLVIIEAMACGRAVIVSEAGGAAEIVSPGTNALVHPPGNAALLAQGILELATHPSLRAALATAGRKTAEEKFDRRRLGREFAAIYESVLSARGIGHACFPRS